jgi:MoxR-like ATPase
MFETIRDNVALLEFRKVESEKFETLAPQLLVNYVKDIPDFIRAYPKRPEIAEFDGELHIMGGYQDMPFFMAYIQANPNAEYNIAVFTDEAIAREKAIATYGIDPDQLLALAPLKSVNSVSETLLQEHGYEDVSEAGKFTRAGVAAAAAARKESPLAKLRTTSNISLIIESAITGFDPKKVNKAPLLLGHSGISKSATIKSVINKLNAGISEADGNWGYRLVDIRAAFFDKMDMLGMITLTSETDGSDDSLASQMNERWSDSPKLELMTCTTSFVESCRAMVSKINSGDVTVTSDDAEFEKRLREYAKTPVMFFDEINRTPKEVMNQLMVMINGHKLNDYDISIAPKLAAANLPVEMEKLDDVDEEKYEKLMYLVQNVDDIAKVDRFIPYIVSSDDLTIQKGAYDYLTTKGEVTTNKVLQELCDYALDQELLHDIAKIDINGKFPTFRGWEDTMTYLGWCLKNKEMPLSDVLLGILGEDTARDLSRWLESSGVEVDTETDDQESFTDHTYRSGLPMMLLGRMGIAKTAGINKAIEKNGDEAIRIDLSSTDRVSVGGFPRSAPFLREAFGFGYKGKTSANTLDEALSLKLEAVTSPLFEEFETEVKARGDVPDQTTSYVPNKQLQDQLNKMRAGQADGKRLVLVFDEINRCTPTVQSAVFEAISDARLFGCDLSGIDYSVVAAGNYDDSQGMDAEMGDMGSTFDAAPIDTATMHRFATKIVREVREKDVQNFREFLQKQFPAAAYIADKMGDEVLMELLNKPYDELDDSDDADAGRARTGGMARPVFTMRTLPAIHNMLETTHPYVFAHIAMDEAAASVALADSPKAQANAFLTIFDDPKLIFKQVDADMGYPRAELRSSGLLKTFGFTSQPDVKMTDVWAGFRDKCISIVNGETAVIEEIEAQYGDLQSFMFRAKMVLTDQEEYLEADTTHKTFEALIPEYAQDAIGEFIGEYYKEQSVKAAQVQMFDEIDFFDESRGDEELDQMVNRYMGSVMNSAYLEFDQIFMNLLVAILDRNPEARPSAEHMLRLKSIYNNNPIAAARPISDVKFSRFLNDYQNKVVGASTMMETLLNTVIDLNDYPLIVEATIAIVANHELSKSGRYATKLESFEQLIAYANEQIDKGADLMLDAPTDADARRYGTGYFGDIDTAIGYLTRKGLGLQQALAATALFAQIIGKSELNVALQHFDGYTRKGVTGAYVLGTAIGHDGYAYPDVNTLIFKGATYNTDYRGVEDVALLRLRGGFDLVSIDEGDHDEDFMEDNPTWFVNYTYKGNYQGVTVTLKAFDVLAVTDKVLGSVTLDHDVLTNDAAKERAIPLMILAQAKALSGDKPALADNFIGDAGRDKLALLDALDAEDVNANAAFLQLSYDISIIKKGGRNEVEKVQALDLLARPNAPIIIGDQNETGFNAAETATLMLHQNRVGLFPDKAEVATAMRKNAKSLGGYLPNGLGDVYTSQTLDDKDYKLNQYNMNASLTRMAKSLRGVWK